MYKTKLIGLFGGPGLGKTSLMFNLAGRLKDMGRDIEVSHEIAKVLVWSKRHFELKAQNYIHGKQGKMQEHLQGQVEYIITDSPSLLSAIYMPPGYPPSFKPWVIDFYKMFDSVNFVLTREKPYNPNGRNQTAEEAAALDDDILSLLIQTGIPYVQIPKGVDRVAFVLKTLGL